MPNILASYMQGQQAVENAKRNKLLDMQIASAPAEQERSNKLADLQLQRGQQQYDITAGEQQKAQELEGLKRGIAGAQYVSQSKSPKTEAEQRYPEFVQQYKAGGGDWDSLDDEGVRGMADVLINELSARAGIGPAEKFERLEGPRGSVLKRNSRTGDISQVVAPGEDFRAKAEFSDQLQRRRDSEQRRFTVERDAQNAEVQRELAKQRALSKDEKATDGQRLSAGFLIRMQDTEPSFGTREESGSFVPSYKPSTKDYVLFNKVLKNEGGFFGSGTAAELNKQLPAKAQEYFQQASDWVRAKLRKESGAVISPQEMISEISTYFPLPGDSQKTIDNKARSREVALEAMKIAAGAPGKDAAAPPRAGSAPAQSPPVAVPSRQNAAPAQIASDAEYNALPSGAKYIGPDGKTRQKR